jgi:hypothetical protein
MGCHGMKLEDGCVKEPYTNTIIIESSEGKLSWNFTKKKKKKIQNTKQTYNKHVSFFHLFSPYC